MQYIQCNWTGRGYDISNERYPAYFESIKDKLPPNARDFAEAGWHYDFKSPKCPHDSWVETVVISEPADGETKDDRGLEIMVKLLGAFHDGLIELRYKGVYAYEMTGNSDESWPKIHRPHGDWLIDEIRLSEKGRVVHEIKFTQATWRIECEDIVYAWIAGKPY
jgi:hypothetical protein